MWPSAPPPPKDRPMHWGVPQALNRPNLHFEGAGNGPVVITWIGREHELYSGASPISLVEHCVTFRHDRRLLSLLGSVHNWPTSRWSATKKEKPVFIKRKWNHVVFSRAIILSFHPVVSGVGYRLLLAFLSVRPFFSLDLSTFEVWNINRFLIDMTLMYPLVDLQ